MGTDQKVLFTIGFLLAVGLIVLDQLYKPEPKPEVIAYEGEDEVIKIEAEEKPELIRINMPKIGKPRKEREKDLSFRPRPIKVIKKEAPHVRVGNRKYGPDERNVNVAHELYLKMSRPADLSTTEIAEVLMSIPKDQAIYEQPKSWHHKVVFTEPFKYSAF